MIDGKKLFDHPVKGDMKTYDNIRKNAAGQGYGYTAGCLLDYNYFKKHYKVAAIDLSKKQVLDANPKAIQTINFTGNLKRDNVAKMFFIIEEAKESVLDFLQGTAEILWMCSTILFCFSILSI